MKPGERREGSIPSWSYDQGHLAGLKGSAAWLWLPAAAMAVSLGVSLPAHAAPYTLPDSSGVGVNLESGAYGGATSFYIAPATVISNTSVAIYAYNGANWNLDNHGRVSSSADTAVFLYGGGTFTNSGTGSTISGDVFGFRAHGAATIVNEGAILGTGTSGTGIYLYDGGSITNSGTGSVINGQDRGIYTQHGATTIFNEGSITGDIGIFLNHGGLITNSGTTSYISGIRANGASTIVNYGVINNSGTYGVGILHDGSGSITNHIGGLITGDSRGISAEGGAFITNDGSITGVHGIGVYLSGGSSLTNSATGVITGDSYGVAAHGSGITIVNEGAITSANTRGIFLYNGGYIRNSGTGSITGFNDGVRVSGGYGTLVNEGAITGLAAFGVSLLHGGTVTNSGTSSLISGAYRGIFANAFSTIVNDGQITATPTGTSGVGIFLGAGGNVTNSGTDSVISGGYQGIYAFGATTILNEGVINSGTSNNFGIGIILHAGGNITNSGTDSLISGVYRGIHAGGFTTILNEGSITATGTYSTGIFLGTGGNVTNSGAGSVISGGHQGIHAGAYSTIFNEGVINSGTSGDSGIYLFNGGTITNSGTSSSIYGAYRGIHAFGPTAISNAGLISGDGGGSIGILLEDGGKITNSGVYSIIRGEAFGIQALGDTTIVNEGQIYGGCSCSGIGIALDAGGKITNSGTASYIGSSLGVRGGFNSGATTIINEGVIFGYFAGIKLYGGGSVTNSGTVSYIRSFYRGVDIAGSGTVTNEGRIIGTSDDGVRLRDGGSVINRAGAVIQGAYHGLDLGNGDVSVLNQGTIVGFQSGVYLYNATSPGVYNGHVNSLTNSGTASYIGGPTGLVAVGTNAIVNEGTIAGIFGVALAGTSTFINKGAESQVYGALVGVEAGGQAQVINQGTIMAATPIRFIDSLPVPANNTLTNAGAIISTNGAAANAVEFGAGDDRLILVQGYSFTGLVQGGAGTNTLEVFSGPASFAMLDGTEFIDFTQLQVDAGATFTFTGPPVIPAGIGFINAGGFTNTGTLTVHGTFTNIGTFTNSGSVIGDINGIINSGGVLTNTGTITGTANDGVVLTGGTLNNTGVVQGGKYGVVVGAGAQVNNSGTILDDAIAGASLGSGASLTNNAGSTLSGVTGVVFTGTGASLTNMGTITGSGGVAIQFDAGSNTATLATGSVLNGSIDGGGGAGQIVLSGTNTLTNTIANFGAGSGLTVAAGANWIASGSWTIANVTNGGTLQPGTAAAPLKLTGNFTQTGAGTFKALLGGTGAQLQVTGTAALGGTVLVIPPDTVLAPTKYTLVAATGGVTGTFSGVTGGTALLGTDLSYDANDAFLTVSQRAVTSPIGVTETPNQLAVAGGFNAGLLANPTAFSAPLALLNQLQAPAFIKALDQMSGENLVDVSTAALLAQRQFIGQVMRQSRLTHGSDQEWSLWASGYGESGHLNGDGNAHRFNGGVSGAAAGADYRVSPALRLGAAAGIGISHFNVAGANGTGRVAYKQIAGTASYDGGPFYVDAMLGGEFGEGTTRRDIVLPGLVSSAAGKINSSQVMGSFEVGYGMSLEETISMTPFARLETGEVDQDAFSETGAGILNLAAPAQSTSSTESLLGARFGTGMPIGAMLVDADFTLGWRHQLAGRGRTGRLSFAGVAGTDFTIAGASLLGDAAELGLGLSTPISDTGAAWVHYDSDYASNGSSQAITVGLRFAW